MAQFIDRLQKHSGTACEPREVEDAAGGDFQVRLRPGPRRKFMELPRRRESAAVLAGMFLNPRGWVWLPKLWSQKQISVEDALS